MTSWRYSPKLRIWHIAALTRPYRQDLVFISNLDSVGGLARPKPTSRYTLYLSSIKTRFIIILCGVAYRHKYILRVGLKNQPRQKGIRGGSFMVLLPLVKRYMYMTRLYHCIENSYSGQVLLGPTQNPGQASQASSKAASQPASQTATKNPSSPPPNCPW